MRSLILIITGILLGAGLLGYGYIRFQEAKQIAYIVETQSSIVTELQSLARLTTTQMTVSKIIEWKKDFSDLLPSYNFDNIVQKSLFDDKLIMTIEAKINAGIDLSKITTWNIVVVAKGSDSLIPWLVTTGNAKVNITVPKAEIFDIYLTEKTKPFERSLGIFSKGNPDLETKMRNDAIVAIKTEALSGNILSEAEANANKVITQFLEKMWVSVWEVVFQ